MVLPKLLRLDEYREGREMKYAILHRVYLHRYQQCTLPRWFRRAFVRSAVHRAWLVGYDGCFSQDGVRFDPANPYDEQRCG